METPKETTKKEAENSALAKYGTWKRKMKDHHQVAKGIPEQLLKRRCGRQDTMWKKGSQSNS
jgi:hypothetical protein